MQSDYKNKLSDFCERDREAFMNKLRFRMANAYDIAFWAAQPECPESQWREYAFSECEDIRNGLACNPKVTIEYFKSLMFSADSQQVEQLQAMIKFREEMEKLPSLDSNGKPEIIIRLA